VGAVAAYHFPAFLARPARFFRIELVRRPFLVGGLAALAGDLTLLILVHRSETALGRLAFLLVAARASALAAFLACRHIDLLVPVGEQSNPRAFMDALVRLERQGMQ
jgi:hypothetical protein